MAVVADASAAEADPTDAERWPGLDAEGAAILRQMRDHPQAPLWRKASGHRLLPEEWPTLRAFEAAVARAPIVQAAPGQSPPDWLDGFLRHALALVPAYRSWGYGDTLPRHFSDLPTTARADLSRDIAAFVPDDQPLDRLINFSTSGTTGHPLLIASHPVVAGRYRAFHERALARRGIHLQAGAGQVGVVLIGWQQTCFTYVSVTPTRAQSGLAKINLHPDDWRDPADRAVWLDAMRAEVYSGDPLSFAELLGLPTRHRPRALLSTSMHLSDGLRSALEMRFDAPVIDLYSMNEAGPIAAFEPELDAHVLLQPQLLVEILDEQQRPLPPGQRGEITLTGGFNFCLPLLRYRTGDHAALERVGADWLLRGLAGRPPVWFERADGSRFNNVELTHALKGLALARWQVWQGPDGHVELRLPQGLAAPVVTKAVAALQARFGPGVRVVSRLLAADAGKLPQYLRG